VGHVTTRFEQKYEHDILILKKSDTVDWIHKCVVYSIQQNSVNATCVGPDRCQIIEYFRLSDGTYTELSSYRFSTAPVLGLYN
jgi:hypothetical protein